jgi:hypothetical protein
MDKGFCQIVVFVDGETHGDCARVVPGYFMFFYGGFLGAPAVFGGGGGGEVPFYVRGAGDEGDVVEVVDLPRCQQPFVQKIGWGMYA